MEFDLSSCDNNEIIRRMRAFNNEKFKTFVRMHLSFILDLKTDECHEEILYEDKGKLKKWKKHSRQHIGGCATAGSRDQSPTDIIDSGFLFHLEEFKRFFLLEKNLTQEGIFRKTGSMGRQNELRQQIKNQHEIDLDANGFSVHDCATVFKGYLSELPEPLLTEAHYPAYLQIATLCIPGGGGASTSKQPNAERLKRDQQLLISLQLLLLLLPCDNRHLLQEIIEILHAVVDYQEFNKMTAANLATLFAPHLICPRSLPPEALHYVAKKMSNTIAFMVLRGMEIFEVPNRLAHDVRAYFLARQRKTTMSPEQTLDDSTSDVNTIFTFVDREKTAAAHMTNTTDTELAQLYAYIQTLPESSKKRRLIKQFNKQNGQGTPLQLVNRLKHSEGNRCVKSFSNSIKKHIFQKGIMSRTPKRTPVQSTTTRVLFQSPVAGRIDSESEASCSTSSNTPYKIHRPAQHWNATLTPSSVASTFTPTLHHNMAPERRSSQLQSSDIMCPLQLAVIGGSVSTLDAISEAPAQKTHGECWQAEDVPSVSSSSSARPDNEATQLITPIVVAKSRYKSEPNLSCLLKDKSVHVPTSVIHENIAKCGKSLTQKLIKGVSMSNLKLPFSTPETTKRLMRSVSSTLKLRPGHDYHAHNYYSEAGHLVDAASIKPLLEDSDHNTDDSSSQAHSNSSGESDTTDDAPIDGRRLQLQHGGMSRNNLNAISTNTPSWMLGRRSISPITKSTQRMSKAMQESIMTPRSRKPVIMLTNALSMSDSNQTACPADLVSLPEKDEELYLGRKQVRDSWLNAHKSAPDDDEYQFQPNSQFVCVGERNELVNEIENNAALTTDFKEYLLSRSVLTASLVDSSFSSQSDDFGSTKELENLEESQLSHSLLYCLDGNQPNRSDNSNFTSDDEAEARVLMDSRNDSLNSNNARKRAAKESIVAAAVDEQIAQGDKENCSQQRASEYAAFSKKLLILNHPGETSL